MIKTYHCPKCKREVWHYCESVQCSCGWFGHWYGLGVRYFSNGIEIIFK